VRVRVPVVGFAVVAVRRCRVQACDAVLDDRALRTEQLRIEASHEVTAQLVDALGAAAADGMGR
jgi:hypothetical protein